MTRTPLAPAPLVYAHRGDRSRAPDNTLAAYRLAVEAGADGIELDVRRTVDDVLVLSHDPSVDELPPLSQMTFTDVRLAAPSVPTLLEMLADVPATTFLNVEIKNAAHEPGFDWDCRIVDATLEAIASHDDLDRILMSSFDPDCVTRAGIVAPGMLRGLLVTSHVPIVDAVRMARDVGAHALHPSMTAIAEDPVGSTATIHDAGLAAVVWNANTPDQVASCLAAGVDVIITDDPSMARAVIDQR